jgi:hypothetical protein
MPHTIFQTPEYSAIMQEHISQVIHYLFEQDIDFSIACEVKHITFNPELPHKIKEAFNESILFTLSGYTRDSAGVKDEYFSFDGGFGSESFGARLMLPLLSIKQIFVDENPIILNFIDYNTLQIPNNKEEKGSEKTSMEALLNNPKNKKFRNKHLKPKS